MYLKLAFKNILRNKTRTLVTLAAIAFGGITLVTSDGALASGLIVMREGMIASSLGHIQIYRKGYSEKGAAKPYDFMISNADDVVGMVSSMPHVHYATKRLFFSGLLGLGETTATFIGVGIDPAKEGVPKGHTRIVAGQNLSPADLKIVQDHFVVVGQNLSPADTSKIVLGEDLAKAVRAGVGDSVMLMTNTKRGALNALDVVVKGHFRLGERALNDKCLWLPISAVQRLLRTSDVHSVVVFLDQTENTQRVAAAMARLFKDKGLDLEIKPWYELSDTYNKTDIYFKAQSMVLRVIISTCVILSIFNTMSMSVLERIGEIGTMLALGYRKIDIVRLFLTEGILLGVIGGILGLVGGYLAARGVTSLGIIMPPSPMGNGGSALAIVVLPGTMFFALQLSVVTALISSVYPAFKASKLEIAEALRQNI